MDPGWDPPRPPDGHDARAPLRPLGEPTEPLPHPATAPIPDPTRPWTGDPPGRRRRPITEASLEREWEHGLDLLTTVLLACVGGLLALLVLSAVVAPFDRDHTYASSVVRLTGRLWFVGLAYAAVLLPVTRAVVRAPGARLDAVRRVVRVRSTRRWLVAVGVAAPLGAFVVLEPVAALITLAVLVAAFLVLAALGVGF